MKMSIGNNIRSIRKEKKMTLQQIADVLGCSPQLISQYENGRRIPKIETLNKIASALGVSITQIKEDITWGKLQNTSQMKQLGREVSAREGIIAILADIYKKVEDKGIEGEYASGQYYLIGEEGNQFILYDDDIDVIYKSVKAPIPFLVERIKDSRPENDVIQEYLEILNSQETHDMHEAKSHEKK